MNKPKQKYQVSMSLGYSTTVEADNEDDAIEIALDRPCASGGEWGEGAWDSDTIDVELAQPETLGEAVVRYEAEVGVGTFEWDGHTISNPFMDDTGRFPVTPLHYGFEITNTGGGATAWVRDEEGPGVELWVTDLNGDAATCDCRGWIIGLYYMGNDEMEPIWSVTVPVNCPPLTDGERIIDIADPDPRPTPDIKRTVPTLDRSTSMSDKKRNENCLAGRKCTGCGSLGPFQIWTLAFITWTDDGTGDGKDFQFSEDAKARCEACRLYDTVKKVLPAPNPITCDDPDCDSERFTAEAQVTMKYVIDGDGDWIEDLGEDESTSRNIDYGSLTCEECGEEATER